MTPQEILAFSMAPAMNAVNSYADGQVALANAGYRNAVNRAEQISRQKAEMILQAARDTSAMERQKENDKASLARTKALLKGQFEKMEEAEKTRLFREMIAKGYRPKNPNTTIEQQLVEFHAQEIERTEKEDRQAAQVLEGFEGDMKQREAAILAERAKLASVANDLAIQKVKGDVSIYTPEVQAAMAKGMAKGASFEEALEQGAKTNPALQDALGVLRGMRASFQQQMEAESKTISQLERHRNDVAETRNRFLSTQRGQRAEDFRLMNQKPPPSEETQEEEDPMAKLARTLMVEKPAAPPTAPPAPSGETQVKTPGWSSVGLGVVPSFPSGILNRPASAMATLMFGGGDEPVAPATKQTNAADVFSLPTPSIQHLFNAPKPIVAGAFARRPTVGAGDLKVVERDTPLPEFDPFLVPGINEISKWDNYGGHAPGNYEPRLNPLDDEPIDGALTPSQHGELLRVIGSDPRYRTRESVEKLAEFIRSEGYRGPRPAEMRNRVFRGYAPPAIDPNLTFQSPQ